MVENNPDSCNKSNTLHWAQEKEVVSSNRPLMFTFALVKHLPEPLVLSFAYPVAFFYYLTSKRARSVARLYQQNLKAYTGGKCPKRISPFSQILSFSMTIIEKMEGWLGRFSYERLVFHEDDSTEFLQRLDEGKGAIVFASHLGNMELLRSMTSFDRTGVSRQIPVTIIMEMKSTEQFNKILMEINSKAALNVISTSEIGPASMEKIQDTLEAGGLVVFAGDRTSSNANTRHRCIKVPFLGKEAEFPYGVFLIPALLELPVYYMFGLRMKNASLSPKYNIFVEKSKIDLHCSRKERDGRLKELCAEFAGKLEKFCKEFPYQFYNFYDFWWKE